VADLMAHERDSLLRRERGEEGQADDGIPAPREARQAGGCVPTPVDDEDVGRSRPERLRNAVVQRPQRGGLIAREPAIIGDRVPPRPAGKRGQEQHRSEDDREQVAAEDELHADEDTDDEGDRDPDREDRRNDEAG
jgi:hypothetical protein